MNASDYAFRNKTGETLIKHSGSINGNGFILDRLQDCEVYVLDHTSQVQVDDCINCNILLGPTDGSVFFRDCRDCTVCVAARQLRTRDCKDMDISLYCATQPSIETSTGIVFSCWRGAYPGLTDHFRQAGMDPIKNTWMQVYDFNSKDDLGAPHYRLDEAVRPWWVVPTCQPDGAVGQLAAGAAAAAPDCPVPAPDGSLFGGGRVDLPRKLPSGGGVSLPDSLPPSPGRAAAHDEEMELDDDDDVTVLPPDVEDGGHSFVAPAQPSPRREQQQLLPPPQVSLPPAALDDSNGTFTFDSPRPGVAPASAPPAEPLFHATSLSAQVAPDAANDGPALTALGSGSGAAQMADEANPFADFALAPAPVSNPSLRPTLAATDAPSMDPGLTSLGSGGVTLAADEANPFTDLLAPPAVPLSQAAGVAPVPPLDPLPVGDGLVAAPPAAPSVVMSPLLSDDFFAAPVASIAEPAAEEKGGTSSAVWPAGLGDLATPWSAPAAAVVEAVALECPDPHAAASHPPLLPQEEPAPLRHSPAQEPAEATPALHLVEAFDAAVAAAPVPASDQRQFDELPRTGEVSSSAVAVGGGWQAQNTPPEGTPQRLSVPEVARNVAEPTAFSSAPAPAPAAAVAAVPPPLPAYEDDPFPPAYSASAPEAAPPQHWKPASAPAAGDVRGDCDAAAGADNESAPASGPPTAGGLGDWFQGPDAAHTAAEAVEAAGVETAAPPAAAAPPDTVVASSPAAVLEGDARVAWRVANNKQLAQLSATEGRAKQAALEQARVKLEAITQTREARLKRRFATNRAAAKVAAPSAAAAAGTSSPAVGAAGWSRVAELVDLSGGGGSAGPSAGGSAVAARKVPGARGLHRDTARLRQLFILLKSKQK